MKVFLCNRGLFKSDQDEGKILPGTRSDYWVIVDDLEQARKVVRDYITANALESTNWLGGQLTIGGKYEGCFSYNGKFWRVGNQFADYRYIWLKQFRAQQRIKNIAMLRMN